MSYASLVIVCVSALSNSISLSFSLFYFVLLLPPLLSYLCPSPSLRAPRLVFFDAHIDDLNLPSSNQKLKKMRSGGCGSMRGSCRRRATGRQILLRSGTT